MSGKSELELLEALEAGPLHFVGEGPGECTSYHNLHVRGLVLGGYNPHLDRFDVALTAEGRARIEELRGEEPLSPVEMRQILGEVGPGYLHVLPEYQKRLYHNCEGLADQGLLCRGYPWSRYSQVYTLTMKGREKLESLKKGANENRPASTGNTHMVLNRLGYSYPGQILKTVHHELCRAHHEHPHFADNAHHAVNLLGEEYGEVCSALNDGDLAGAVSELGQVITVSVRTMELLLKQINEQGEKG